MNKEEIKINCTNDVFKYTPDQIYDVIYDLQQRIDKAKDFCEKQKTKMYKSRNKIALFVLMKLEKILNRTIGE